MLKFLGRIVAGQNSKQFEEQLRRVKIFLYAELSMEYQRDFDSELASILARTISREKISTRAMPVLTNPPDQRSDR